MTIRTPELPSLLLRALRPPLRDRRFWIVQSLVVLMAGIHETIDIVAFLPSYSGGDIVPVALFLIPVVYAALNFGLTGSFATAAWVTLLTVPDTLLVRQEGGPLPDLIQLLIIDAVAIFVGQRVERERIARGAAEQAHAAIEQYAKRVLRSHEEERRRIAHEIHDEPVQELVLLCRMLDAVPDRDELSPAALRWLEGTRERAEATMRGLRDMAHGLRPPALDELGLAAALRRFCKEFQRRTGVRARFASDGPLARLDPTTELGLFRIVQEALHNVEKHADARHVSVQLDRDGLRIRDDGRGFDRAHVGGRCLGLLGMHERAQLIGGRVVIHTRPGEGTEVTLLLASPKQVESPARTAVLTRVTAPIAGRRFKS